MENNYANNILVEFLELSLIEFGENKFLKKYVKNTKDIYFFKTQLKRLPPSNSVLKYFAELINNDLENKKRFRKKECVKVLRAIIRNSQTTPTLDDTTLKALFNVYKGMILILPEDGQWFTSVLIKNQELADEDIRWLIDNYTDSIHLLNRLLLYPVPNRQVYNWAKNLAKKDIMPENRESEVIACILNFDENIIEDYENDEMLIWAIAKSKIPDDRKIALLEKFINNKNFDLLIQIAQKYKFKKLLQKMLTIYSRE